MKFTVAGTTYELDEQQMTFGEARDIEKVTGHPMSALAESVSRDMTAVQALVWVAMRRTDPTLTFVALDDMPIGDIEWDEGDEESEGNPPEGAEAGLSSSTPSETGTSLTSLSTSGSLSETSAA